MHSIWTALVAVARSRAARQGGRRGPGLARLLAGEVVWAARQAIHPVKVLTAALVAVGVGVALGPTTPGPILGAGWRLAVAALLGLVALGTAHRLLGRPSPRGAAPGQVPVDAVEVLRVVVGSVAALLAGTIVLATLLAVITGSDDVAQPGDQPLAASLAVDPALLGGAALLGLAVLAAGVTRRLALPASLLLLGLGMALGTDGLGAVRLDDPQLVQSLGVIALVIILFDGGLSTDREHLRLGTGPGLALATVGVALTAGITAVGAMWLLDLTPRIAWLIGAIVASTDATAVFGLLRHTPVADRLAAILRIESGTNDPVAVLLTVGLLSAWDAPPTAGAWLAFGALQLLGGVAVGGAVGWVGGQLLRRAQLGSAGLYPVLALAVGGVAYGTAALVGGSGFLAVYVTGIVVAVGAPRRRGGIRSVVGSLSSGVEVGLFLLLGLLVVPSDLPGVAGVALGVTALLVLVARPLAVSVTLAWFDLPARVVAAAAWLGMRGAVPIVLATLAFSAGIPEAGIVFDLVFFVVVTSALAQGTTAGRVVRRLGVGRPDAPARTVVEALPLDDVDVDVLEVALDASSPLVGRQIIDCPPPDDLLIAAVVRDGRVLVPRGRTRLAAGDRLVLTTAGREGVIAAEGWASAGPTAIRSGVELPAAVGAQQPRRAHRGHRTDQLGRDEQGDVGRGDAGEGV